MPPTDDIKQRLDLVDLISEFVKLKPAGSNSFKANCPFHREKTPSFYVSREKQIWHCFGCSLGGDHFAFLMQMEGIDFPEALRQLAEKTGLEIQRFSSEGVNRKVRLLKLLDLTARFFHKCLMEAEAAKIARDYLARRGVPAEMTEKFLLGYAPDRWDALLTVLKKHGFSETEMIEAGLVIRREGRSGGYDRFRHRLIFPIADVSGKIVGFTGRLLDEARQEGKYINTPQTLVYNKSQALYGLSLAKQAIKDAGAVILVEGNLDVIASHKAGAAGVVASSGTALTTEQLALLWRFTDTVLVCFDADPAGEQAAKRGIDLALEEGMNVKVIRLQNAKDPDELVVKDPALWRRAIAEATDVMSYYFQRVFATGAPHTASDKKRVGNLLLPEIVRLQNPIERDHWIKELSHRLDVSESILLETMAQQKKNASGSPARREAVSAPLASQPLDRRALLSEEILALIFSRSELREDILNKISADHLSDPYRRLYLFFISRYSVQDNLSTSDKPEQIFFGILRSQFLGEQADLLPLFDRLILQGERNYGEREPRLVRDEGWRMIESLRTLAVRDQRALLTQELRAAEQAGDAGKIQELTKKFTNLT
ncbi:DNA primase [Candidatus Uhrbacteria bacterium]|nr:DNA primase [Candidatus Uhrbacteria bacterium]